MYFEIYKDEQLVNTIVASDEFVAEYCAKNGYTYIKKEYENPEPVEPEPTEEDDTAAMLVDHEYRLTLLELGLTE